MLVRFGQSSELGALQVQHIQLADVELWDPRLHAVHAPHFPHTFAGVALRLVLLAW